MYDSDDLEKKINELRQQHKEMKEHFAEEQFYRYVKLSEMAFQLFMQTGESDWLDKYNANIQYADELWGQFNMS
jgi:hypothetical protein